MSSTAAPAAPLTEPENEVIAFFVDTVRWFGAPKSLGAIYGLLFISAEPISFEQIATRLQMSNGSVSQGLKILKDLGAVKTAFLPGERRDFFVAETQFRQLGAAFLRQRVERHLVSGEGRLNRIFEQVTPEGGVQSSPTPHLHQRLELLRRWQVQARGALPAVLKLLES